MNTEDIIASAAADLAAKDVKIARLRQALKEAAECLEYVGIQDPYIDFDRVAKAEDLASAVLAEG